MLEMILNSGLKFRVDGCCLAVTGNAGLVRKWRRLIDKWKPAIISSLIGFDGISGGPELMESVASIQREGGIVSLVGAVDFVFGSDANLILCS